MGKISIPSLIYLLIGAIIANNRGYFGDLRTVPHIISALLAVLLWPLILLGINLHIAYSSPLRLLMKGTYGKIRLQIF